MRKFTNEKQVYKALKKLYASHPILWERVENRVGGGGTDVVAIKDGKVRWIELKIGAIRKTDGLLTVPRGKLRASQFAWLTRASKYGGRCFIVVGAESDIYVYRFEPILFELLPRGVVPGRGCVNARSIFN